MDNERQLTAARLMAQDTISGSLAECYIIRANQRFNFMSATNLEANFDKTKKDMGILGQTGKAHRSTGWEGTGKATFRYNTSIFREMFLKFKDTGQDEYFDIQITNLDPTSTVGAQTVILKNCNIDGGILAKFDIDAEVLEEEMEFTFDDFEIPETFSLVPGMLGN